MSNISLERPVTLGEFRRLALEETKRQLLYKKEIEESLAAGGFMKRLPPPLIVQVSFHELYSQIVELAKEIIKEFPSLKDISEKSVSLGQNMLEAQSVKALLESYLELLEIHGFKGDTDTSSDNFSIRAGENIIYIEAREIGNDTGGIPPDIVKADMSDQAFVAAVANMIAVVRKMERPLTKDERSAVLAAYRLLDRGVQVPSAYQSIGISGFRKYQTNLSVANPGEGHIQVTCSSTLLLAGTVIHIEHIDRDGERDREKLEPYRLPAIINAARVRLHTGTAAPCTAFIGRPIFESGNVIRDLLKSVHMTSGACTSMFMNGVSDCKIGIERMTSSEATKFMRAVAGNVVRDPTRQYLSAAFNINLPIIDDRDGNLKQISNKFEIARLGIDLAVEGRFEKVTWDGSSNQEPSIPIVEQLSYEELIELIHLAHERGLETYISAGLQPHHMKECTYLGVDGVGIGTSLHDYNPDTGLRGQLKKERVQEVLEIRNVAAGEPLGRGAALLAKMDRMYFEGTLPISLESKRQKLFELMKKKLEEDVNNLIDEIGEIPGSVLTQEHPVIEQAKRMLISATYDSIGANRDSNWNGLMKSVEKLVKNRDISELYDLLP
ncbi:hypothetical protein GXP67_00975 [Rhodocytophaga rosea]|uniref:Uncharacterized protein n=1 Tax=Rhodocytophaga rosea TaxID=2704465 RepID=A0A6C0GBM4_9BACT|nr:hypothetical protein [Rhodocytophaga rosea]QHT65345.1 hypothetical protein GXP67_00975 [Rhodocytophaga rosea]